jgi:hypothetical protein
LPGGIAALNLTPVDGFRSAVDFSGRIVSFNDHQAPSDAKRRLGEGRALDLNRRVAVDGRSIPRSLETRMRMGSHGGVAVCTPIAAVTMGTTETRIG